MRARIFVVATTFLSIAVPSSGQQTGNIRVTSAIQPIVAEALEKSPTFRRQYGAITAARLVHVFVHAGDPPSDERVRARTTIRKYSSGLLLAVVNIPAGGHDEVELLAHEFEHVIEQMEHVNLDSLARTDVKAAWIRPDGAYETARAQQIGIAAAAEVTAAAVAARHGHPIHQAPVKTQRPQSETEKHR